MTSKLKCPVCQGNMHQIDVFMSVCINDKCKLWGSSIPNLVLEALTQAKQDLEKARYAITDVFSYVKEHEKDIGGCAVNIGITLLLALERITHDNSEKPNSQEHKEI